MNKNIILSISKLILVFIIFFIELSLIFIEGLKPMYLYINMILLIILTIIYFIFIKNESLLNNRKYQIINIISLAVILFVFLRALIDPTLMINPKDFNYVYETNSKIMFLYNNMIYFSIIEAVLIIYPFFANSKDKHS